jgi:glucose/mannose transport system permease protein
LRASTRQTAYILLITFGFWLFYALGWWSKVWPGLDDPLAELEKGYRVALSGVIIAAVWQMSGYVMALFLAGIRGVPDDLREAARVDGCAEWQVYFYVILPSLRPIALSAIIILGHISLKIFDLVFAMAGPDNNQTIVPGILLYTKAFRGNRLASGSAVAMVMLVLVSIVIVPYLWTSLRREESQ